MGADQSTHAAAELCDDSVSSAIYEWNATAIDASTPEAVGTKVGCMIDTNGVTFFSRQKILGVVQEPRHLITLRHDLIQCVKDNQRGGKGGSVTVFLWEPFNWGVVTGGNFVEGKDIVLKSKVQSPPSFVCII